MNRPSLNIPALVLLLGYLLGGFAIELMHSDTQNIRFSSRPVLTSHDCDEHGQHHVPGGAGHCPACSQSAPRIAIVPSSFLPGTPIAVLLGSAFDNTSHQPAAHYFSSGKRGPPAA